MLYKLLEQINDIIPVIRVSKSPDNIINIDYNPQNLPSEIQLQEINNIILAWPLNEAKLHKTNLLDNNWNIKIKNGWQTSYGYSLGLDISDITLLNGAFTLAKEANNMGITDPTIIVDTNGQSHSLSLSDLTILMLQYGQARALLSNTYATIKQSINNANTLEELEAINITL